jgi:hypothetical protein
MNALIHPFLLVWQSYSSISADVAELVQLKKDTHGVL